jgi:anthraniloyl-CoA monooxygenase
MLIGMTRIEVGVLGGGPAGLTAARLLKCRHPSWTVTVYERHQPDDTFGYGVGLGWGALACLEEQDPGLAARLKAAARHVDTWTVQRGDEQFSAKNSHGLGISRSLLLRILQQHAAEAGVVLVSGAQVTHADLSAADIVLAADGVGSQTRAGLAPQLGVDVVQGQLSYLWCGADLSLDAMTLSLVNTTAGPVAAHVMPYGTSSTFQLDTHRDVLASWDLMDDAATTLEMLEGHYAHLLAGNRLRTQHTLWQTFATVSCERWYAGSTALLGDAAHTAHYSVGSGTGLAIEDAVALDAALAGEASVTSAFQAYQEVRKPRVSKLQFRAARSQAWWTSLSVREDVPLPQLLLSYLTRTGAVTLQMVAEQNPDLLESCLVGAKRAQDLASHVFSQPFSEGQPDRLHRGDTVATLPVTVAGTAASTTEALSLARAELAQGRSCLRLTGPDGRDALAERLVLAELLRSETKITTVVTGSPELRDDLALGVLTGQTDLVELTQAERTHS